MLEYFKNIASKNSCLTGAVCSVHPSVNSLYEVILNEVSEISFYVVKLREFGFLNEEINAFLIDALTIFLINTSFNHKKYFSFILKLDEIRNETKDKYLKYYANNNLPYEIINKNMQINSATTISELIEYGENITNLRQKNSDTQKQSLFELVVLMAKLAAINIVKIKKINHETISCLFDFEILKFFSLINDYTLRIEKIKRKILEFSNVSFEIKKKLYILQQEKYGQKETATVNLSIDSGHNILVSGDDFDELDNVLKEVSNFKTQEKINVYTNGALFLANLYPYFKNNKFLKGHYGTDNAEYDFSNFEGAVLITQNFVQKIDSLYRGEIFSKKLISFSKVSDIENNNYKPLIEASLKYNKTSKQENQEIKIEYDKEKLENMDCETVLIMGKQTDYIKKEKIETKNIIHLSSSIEGDLLLDKIKYFKEKNINITIFFSECTIKNLDLLFSILNFRFKIYFVSCSNILINPHTIQALKENLGVEII